MKERLDVLLVRQGHFASRAKAKAAVETGGVFVDGRRAVKAGETLEDTDCRIEVRGAALPYVSRGGLKLEKAIREFHLDLGGKVCMDIGASTGGFTDCMLQNGAARVYAVDVGQGQLARRLREDARVICMEKTNFRYMTRADISDAPDFASCDVSFISLTKILEPAYLLLKQDAGMVCLIKPQFEAGRDKVGKKGVVREPQTHRNVIAATAGFALSVGFIVQGLTFSPVKGPEGNIEYLLCLRKEARDMREPGPVRQDADGKRQPPEMRGELEELAAAVVKRAHEELGSGGQ